MMNRMLQQQLDSHFKGNPFPEQYKDFIETVSHSYDCFENRANFLEREKEQLIKIQQLAGMGSWEMDLTADEFTAVPWYWSDETYRMLGHERGNIEPTYKSYLQSVYPDDRRRVEQLLANLLKDPGTFDIEYRVIRSTGEQRILRNTGELLIDPVTLKPHKLVGNVQDLTERRKAEAALCKANNELRTLFNTMDEIIFSVDMEQLRLIQLSPSCEKLYGYPPEAFMENPSLWFQIILVEDQFNLNFEDPSLLLGGTCVKEFRVRHKNGNIRWIECRMTPTFNSMDKLIRVDGICSDITLRINNLEALRISNENLQKSNKELDRFVYSVSHDLRAPLASMLGVIQYAESETSDPDMLENLALMKSSAQKLDIFILDILDYSKNSRMGLNPVEIDFNGMLQDITTNLKFMSAGKGEVELFTDIQTARAFYSDRTRLGIILSNLISNSIRYYNPAATHAWVKVQITVSIEGANIVISDNGRGIDPKFHEKIFEMFYRVSQKSIGSGLGLYIVKETVERLNGKMTLESTPDLGTTFTIHLPDLINTST